ncbi:hypothetical protein [Pseudooceanicola pacificus]|jgi:hypothetical protein|nr:hypothetical protein [Pseudooceanicola pacificus]
MTRERRFTFIAALTVLVGIVIVTDIVPQSQAGSATVASHN